jgi:hypothetical protein
MHPCYSDPSDFRPMGHPETIVELDGGIEVAVGLLVPRPFGPGTDAILTVHATRGTGNDGGTILLAITNAMELDVHPPSPAMDMRLLNSNPRRVPDEGEDAA